MPGFIICVHTVGRDRAAMLVAARHDGYDAYGARDLEATLHLVQERGRPRAILLGDLPTRTRKTFLGALEKEPSLARAALVYVSGTLLHAWLSAAEVGPPEVQALRKTLEEAVRGIV